ncbi:bifunctional nicotinamidase/pyrazinamidase [Weeksellaceae bacterium TAE3-ERU29]|nr:bifunctional nicotinamidase/pyrazinamidase [Weeksellaceae bacterium TAE3-ERU29]
MKALLIVDAQNDFMPGGSLAVAKGNEIIPFINSIINNYDVVVASQDWHPENHKSFVTQHPDKNLFDIIDLNGLEQVLWPPHCVQGTKGAELHPDLDIRPIEAVFRKGMDKEVDSYSVFYDNGKRISTRLSEYLKAKKVDTIDVVGLAADFCVNFSIQDALKEGFKVNLILEGTKAIDDDNFKKILEDLKANSNFKAI